VQEHESRGSNAGYGVRTKLLYGSHMFNVEAPHRPIQSAKESRTVGLRELTVLTAGLSPLGARDTKARLLYLQESMFSVIPRYGTISEVLGVGLVESSV
jgi:hypothetical protein